MSTYSRSVRARFLSQFALACASLTVAPYSAAEPSLRLYRPITEALGTIRTLCPLTATCFHATNTLFYSRDYPHAAEELAMPRGMAHAIARAADATVTTPWRQRCLEWWRAQLLAGLPEEGSRA